MTENETKALLHVLKVTYPQALTNVSNDERTQMVTLWHHTMKNLPFALAEKAAEAFIKCDKKGFMPCPGQIMEQAKQLVTDDADGEADQAWQAVLDYLQSEMPDGLFLAHEGYYRLPVRVQEIYSWSELCNTARRDDSSFYVNGVMHTNFVKQYKELKSKEEANALATGNILSISKPEKIKALGLSEQDLQTNQIEMEEGKN